MSNTVCTNVTKTIRISNKVHSRLNDIGKRGETFSDIIDRLIDEYKILSKQGPVETLT